MIESLELIGLYFANVIIIALPFAIFEIWLERFKSGWGGEFYNKFLGKKICNKFLLSYLTVYHFVIFSIIALLLAVEFLIMRQFAGGGLLILKLENIKLVSVVYFTAVWMGIIPTEDFLWFTLNWRYPESLKRLLTGDVKWHVGWVSVTRSVKLPSVYFKFLTIILVLLTTQFIITRLF